MPIIIRDDEATDVTYITCRGVITMADLQTLRVQLKQLRGLRSPSGSALVNLCDAHLQLTPSDIRTLIANEPIFARIAIFAPAAANYGLARMYEILTEQSRHVAVFNDWADALSWVAPTAPQNNKHVHNLSLL